MSETSPSPARRTSGLAVCLFFVGAALAGVLGPQARAQSAPCSAIVRPAACASAAAHAAPQGLDTTEAPPPARRADRWLAMDKAKHAGGSFLLVLGGQYVFEEKARLERDPALALSLASGAAVGVAKELYDWRLGPTGHFSRRDLIADLLGLLLGAGVVLL